MKLPKKSLTYFILIFLTTLTISLLFISKLVTQPLKVIYSNPSSNSAHNPFSPISIAFNQNIDPDSINLSLSPSTPIYTTKGVNQNELVITPQTRFQPETDYILAIATQPEFKLNFTTLSELGQQPGWNQIFNQAINEYLETSGPQDMALAKIRHSVPILKESFTIDYSYKNHTYIVDLTPPYEQSKKIALDYLKQAGVVDLSSLNIQWIED